MTTSSANPSINIEEPAILEEEAASDKVGEDTECIV
jgi:hypothetical protein